MLICDRWSRTRISIECHVFCKNLSTSHWLHTKWVRNIWWRFELLYYILLYYMFCLLLPGLCIPKTRTPLAVSDRRPPISDSSGTSPWRPLSSTRPALISYRWPVCCCPGAGLAPHRTFSPARPGSTTNDTVRNNRNTSPRTDKPYSNLLAYLKIFIK